MSPGITLGKRFFYRRRQAAVFYTSFSQFLRCCRIFGIFPITEKMTILKTRQFTSFPFFLRFLPVFLIISLYCVELFFTMKEGLHIEGEILDRISHFAFQFFDKIFTCACVIHFNRGACARLHTLFLRNFCNSAIDSLLLPVLPRLKRRWRLFAAVIFVLAVTYTSVVVGFIWNQNYEMTRIVTSYVEINYILLFNALCVTYYYSITWCFIALDERLKRILGSVTPLPTEVRRLRLIHEQLAELSDDFVTLMTPILPFYFLFQTINVCNLTYWTCTRFVTGQSTVKSIAIVVLVFCRALPLAWHCVAGGRLTLQSCAGLKQIYSSPLDNLSPDEQYQLAIFESKMATQPVFISASGFVHINNKLLVQILGVIITYVLVMVQFREEENKST